MSTVSLRIQPLIARGAALIRGLRERRIRTDCRAGLSVAVHLLNIFCSATIPTAPNKKHPWKAFPDITPHIRDGFRTRNSIRRSGGSQHCVRPCRRWWDQSDRCAFVHNGRVVKRTGEGIIIEFRSVVDAVRCAIEVRTSRKFWWHGALPARTGHCRGRSGSGPEGQSSNLGGGEHNWGFRPP